jgi:hypothetical protein
MLSSRADVALVQGGPTTTMELTAAGRPFVYVPLQNHFEQNVHVRHRLARYGAGRCVPWPEATPERLAAELAALVGTSPEVTPVESEEPPEPPPCSPTCSEKGARERTTPPEKRSRRPPRGRPCCAPGGRCSRQQSPAGPGLRAEGGHAADRPGEGDGRSGPRLIRVADFVTCRAGTATARRAEARVDPGFRRLTLDDAFEPLKAAGERRRTRATGRRSRCSTLRARCRGRGILTTGRGHERPRAVLLCRYHRADNSVSHDIVNGPGCDQRNPVFAPGRP